MLISIGIGGVSAQEKESIGLLKFQYGFQVPAADMSERFGGNSIIGAGMEMANLKTKLFGGIEGMFLFGSVVKEDVVAGLRTFDGSIIGKSGQPADVNLKERGYYIGLFGGRVFGSAENNLSGLRLQLGGGLLQHKIRVQDNSRSVVALEKNNLKGFDRLTNGPALHLGIGYQLHNSKNNFHFHIMGDVYAARTQSRRDFDNVTGGYLSDERTDLLFGLNVAYIVIISRAKSADEIYY